MSVECLSAINDITVQHNYTVSQKNDTSVAHYNFDIHQPILAKILLKEYAIKR